MFNYLVSFWRSILLVFWDTGAPVNFYWIQNFGSGAGNPAWSINLNVNQFAQFFSFLSLLGMSIFLFYQVYKVIHAFVGGFYE